MVGNLGGFHAAPVQGCSKLTNLTLFSLFKVLQLTKEANRPMERNLSSSGGNGNGNGRMVGNRTKSASTVSSPSAPVNFIPINAAEACDDNLCFNGGFCDPLSLKCRCRGHFIGKFSR